MSTRESEVMARIDRAKSAILRTGETFNRSEGGRAPVRSEMYREAKDELHLAEQARNRLLAEVVGPDADTIPVELAKRFGLTGREAAHVINTARNGSPRVRAHVFGEPSAAG